MAGTGDDGVSRQDAEVGVEPIDATITDDSLVAELAARDGPEAGATIGRYVVLSRLGTGAMGVVYAAYDPELDRRVALKLLKPRGGNREAARARLQREAQALAKLNHTNVVAVHDVGMHGEQVFVAMEFVEGQTLGQWLEARARPWREVVGVFADAGRGLVAAHQEGLVHRDFKPDNVMLGADGRARVMDFGLARAGEVTADSQDREPIEFSKLSSLDIPLTQTGSLMGTPAYMAPEQLLSREVTARADQFSFCVALHEALYGQRPFGGESLAAIGYNVLHGTIREPPRGSVVPTWLRRVVLRGLSREPEDRFGTMAEVVALLDNGERHRRRSRTVLGFGVVGLGLATPVGYDRYERAQQVEDCETRGDLIDEAWNPEARHALRKGLVATGLGYAPAVADNVMPWVDQQAEAWREASTSACMHARVEGRWSEAQLDKAGWCLDERRLQLATFADQMSRADARAVPRAVQTAAGLSPIAPCVDEHALAVMPEPPAPDLRAEVTAVREAIVRAQTLVSSGDYERGLAVARDARESAELLAWPPLTATAHLTEGLALTKAGDYPRAEAAYSAAFMEAGKGGSWDTAAAAASRLVFVVGYEQSRHDEGKTWAELGSVAIAHATDPLGLREAARASSLGNLYYSMGKYEASIEHHRRSLEIAQSALGPDHPDVALDLVNLGNGYFRLGRYEEALDAQERALAIKQRTLGSEHPDVASSLTNLGNLRYRQGKAQEAKALFQQALAIKERALGEDHPDVATSLANLGNVHNMLGEYEEAIAAMERSLAIQEGSLGPSHPNVAMNLSNLGIVCLAAGQPELAKQRLERALAILHDQLGPDHVYLAWPQQGLGQVLVALGDYERAVAHFERAIAIRESNDVDPSLLAGNRFELAKALWDAPEGGGGDRRRARELAESARATYAEAGSVHDEAQRQIEAWLAEHP